MHDWSQTVRLQVGDTVEVLVNAERPDYAELPGRPATTSVGWIFVLGLAALILLVTIAVAIGQRRARLRPRSVTPAPPIAPPTADPPPGAL